MITTRSGIWAACLGIALLGCSDESNPCATGSDSYLRRTIQQMIADGLSDAPSEEFREVRGKVVDAVPADKRSKLGRVDFSDTKANKYVSDPDLADARTNAAKKLGTRVDPGKVKDTESAQLTLDAMRAELSARFDGATSCEAIEDAEKVVDCIVTLVVAEVRRTDAGQDDPGIAEDAGQNEQPDAGGGDADTAMDGDVAQPDSGSDASAPLEAGTVDAGPTNTFNCTSGDVSQALKVTSVDSDQTWSGLISLSGSVRVNNAKLTIQPGTTIIMNAGALLDVGYNGAASSIYANGTAENPIRFCGRNANPGFWDAVYLEGSVSADSVLRHVRISDGGSRTAALSLAGRALLEDVQVRNSGKDGVLASALTPGGSGLSVEGSGGSAVVLTTAQALNALPTGVSIKSNADDSVHLRFTNYDQSVTIRALSVPYVQEQNLRVIAGTTTLEAGVQVKFSPDQWLDVGYNSSIATLLINGTAEAPVVLSGVSPQPGGWNGLYIGTNVQSASKLSYLTIKHAGANPTYNCALCLNAPITVDHVAVEDSAAGVDVSAEGFSATSTSLKVTGLMTAGKRPLNLLPDALISIPPGSSFVGNAINQVLVRAGNFSKVGTVAKLDVPYFIAGNFRTLADSQLTIAPGVELLMGSGVWFEIGYNGGSGAKLVANGTADAPIRFTGLDPAAGSWRGLFIGAAAQTSSSLRYVEVAHAGGDTSYPAAVWTDVSMTIESCNIHDSARWGVSKKTANALDYASLNTFTNVTSGTVTTH